MIPSPSSDQPQNMSGEPSRAALIQTLRIWSADGALQTFEDRERFRSEARAVIAQAEEAAR